MYRLMLANMSKSKDEMDFPLFGIENVIGMIPVGLHGLVSEAEKPVMELGATYAAIILLYMLYWWHIYALA
jgi:hypothetical protein